MKMKKWSSQWTQFMQLRKEAWKQFRIQRGLSPWPRDTGEMLYQLSYEATDVGSRSIDLLSTPELLIDLTYVFLEYIFFRAIVISVP